MRFPSVPRTLLALAAAAFVLAPPPVASGAPSASDDLTGQASYTCQYAGLESEIRTPPGLGLGLPSLGFDLPSLGGSDKVAVKVTLNAPNTVEPGQSVKLTGESTFTFGTRATATNLSTAFTFLSDDFGVNVSVGGFERLLRIADLKTSKSTLGKSVVTARWSLPEFLVPSSAAGQLTLALPDGEIVTNPVTTKPKAVAFTGTLVSDSLLQPKRSVACAAAPKQDDVIATAAVLPTSAIPTPTDEQTPGAVAAPPLSGPGAPVAAPGLPVTVPQTPPTLGAPTTTSPLAAEAIPPPTVPEGVRLPAWALLLIGGFVATGLLLAVSSHLRLRLLAAAAVVLALLVAPTPLNPSPPAQAAANRAQVTLICVYNDTDAPADARARDQPTGLSMSLDVPASVKPGEVITLSGSATVQAPEDIRSQAAQLGFNQLDAISDSLSVGLTVGSGKRQVFTADRWQTGKTSFSNPLVVSAPLNFPSFRVPENASGSIKLELPRNEVLNRKPPPHSNPRTPPRTALEFFASVSGNGAKATYLVACWRTDKGDGAIATIPVSKAAAPAAGSGGPGSAPTQSGANPVTPPSAAGSPGVVAPGATPSPGAGSPSATGSPGAPVVAGAPVLQGVPAGAEQTAYADDVAVPTWLLIVLGILAVLGYGYAGRNYRRARARRGA